MGSPTIFGSNFVRLLKNAITFNNGVQVSAPAASGTIALTETAINAQVGTTYTLALTDNTKMVTLNNASAITLIVPLNASVAFPVGASIGLAQLGAGQPTVTATGGVTILSVPGLKLRAQYSGATLFKLATDTWILIGDLSA